MADRKVPQESTLLLSEHEDDGSDRRHVDAAVPYISSSSNSSAVTININDGDANYEMLTARRFGQKDAGSDVVKKKPSDAAKEKSQSDAANDARRSLREANWSRIFLMAAPEKWLMIFGTVALFLSSITVLVIPAFAGVIVDRVVNDRPDGGMGPPPPPDSGFDPRKFLDNFSLNQIILLLFGVFFIGSIFAFFRAMLFTIAGERVVARMRNMLFQSVLTQEIAFFDETRTGDLTNRLSSDTMVLQNTVTVNVSMGLRYLAQAFGGILLLFYISWKLTLVMLSCVPIVAIGAVVYGNYVRRLAKERQDALARASEVAEESFSNVRTVRSFSKEDYESSRYALRVNESYELGKKIGIAFGGFAGGVAFIAQIALGLVLWYGAVLVLNDELTPGELTSFLMYTLTVAFSFGGISALYADFMKAVGASERVFQLMDREPKVRFYGGVKLDRVSGQVEFRDVHFSYPSRPDVPVLKGLRLSLSPGRVVALVGHSGGGKTTVANLLELFYYPESGEITLDGYNIQQLDIKALHEHIGIVSQGPCLFAASIRDNIAYGLPDMSLERVMEAAKLANAHEFIARFPDGYDTLVGERGVRLSGGQKQRIAIARALLKDPKILLLDEATSDLDSESEHLVQEALDRLMQGRTVLVIAHRLSTVRNADQIIVIERGTAAEQGTHDQLMEQSGIYRQLVSHQLHSAQAQPTL